VQASVKQESLAAAPDLFRFDNSYARLPERFFARVSPTPVAAPRLIRINRGLADQLGIDAERLAQPDSVGILAGNSIAPGSEPIAMAYAGHQFANFVPQLGDGRAILLGEVIGKDGIRRDIQLKGSGKTPFSRRGDGRAALGPVLREYILSEAMAALGIPTTRTLAAVLTGETVMRETLLPGAVLTRIAASHIRIGTFQFFAARGDAEALKILSEYVITRHYPEAAQELNPILALLGGVIARQADLVARWLSVGFIHGVMNTDNMAISGETIDYGPCAFMDAYHPATVYSSIDSMGRYAYGNQPSIAQWNLIRFAETLLPLLAETEEAAIALAQEAIDRFPSLFQSAYAQRLGRKIGLAEMGPGDFDLAQQLLKHMADTGADFTLTFRHLADAVTGNDTALRAQFPDTKGLENWLPQWRQRLAQDGLNPAVRREAMRQVNPLFIPRNHLVEEAIEAATKNDYTIFDDLLAVLASPYDDQPAFSRYALPPRPDQIVHQTFCGT
jgi:uncharacterized protein YdiU (UPF0061 family)